MPSPASAPLADVTDANARLAADAGAPPAAAKPPERSAASSRPAAPSPRGGSATPSRPCGDDASAPAVASTPVRPTTTSAAPPSDPPAAKRRRANGHHPPSPAPLVDGPLPESLAEWKDLAESALRQLYAHKRQGLLDWPLVKGAINCAIVSCPIASHRAEMRALRDNGVYGSSMAPYLDELRRVYDATEARKAEAEEAPAEFSESDEESDEESDDDASDDSDDESKEDSESESDTGEDQLVEVAEETRGGSTEGGDGFEDTRVATGSERRGKHPARASAENAGEKKATATGSGGGKQKPSGGLLRGVEKNSGNPPSAYQLEMRAKYKRFSRFLGEWFARERMEQATVAALLAHPDAAPFADEQVAAFLDMMQRENKIMLHEGTVMII